MYADRGNRLSVAVNSQGLGRIRPVMQLSFPGALALRLGFPSGARAVAGGRRICLFRYISVE
jgi:hypothetical protein